MPHASSGYSKTLVPATHGVVREKSHVMSRFGQQADVVVDPAADLRRLLGKTAKPH